MNKKLKQETMNKNEHINATKKNHINQRNLEEHTYVDNSFETSMDQYDIKVNSRNRRINRRQDRKQCISNKRNKESKEYLPEVIIKQDKTKVVEMVRANASTEIDSRSASEETKDGDSRKSNVPCAREKDIELNQVRKRFISIMREKEKDDLQKNKFKHAREENKKKSHLGRETQDIPAKKTNNRKSVSTDELLEDNIKSSRNISKVMGDVMKNVYVREHVKIFCEDEIDIDHRKSKDRKLSPELDSNKNRGEGDITSFAQKTILNDIKIDDIRAMNSKELTRVIPVMTHKGRKEIWDRYTVRLKNNIKSKEDTKLYVSSENINIEDEDKKEELPQTISSEIKKSSHNEQKTAKKLDAKIKDTRGQRKPLIKTVKLQNNNIYKAVTFIEKNQPTPLLINIPIEKTTKLVDENVQDDSKERELSPTKSKSMKMKRSKRRRVSSPDLLVRGRSPLTEVAKWAPSCINHQTKPYYEAWVDTTLAAIAKCSKDAFVTKNNLVETLKKALRDRPPTPEEAPVEDIDERYLGKIRIRHR